MSNSPNNWFEFLNNKELKRLRKETNNTLALKIQVSVSIILTIITFFLGENLKLNIKYQILICVLMIFVTICIFITPFVINRINLMKHCNVIIEGKDAISIFQENIVYDVLVAVEYSNSLISFAEGENVSDSSNLQNELAKFYKSETKYHVEMAIEQLYLLNSSFYRVFGSRDNQISLTRLGNILSLIDSIIELNDISLGDSQKTKYNIFKSMYNNKIQKHN